MSGHLDVVRWLLEFAVDRDARNSQGKTALDLAAEGGHKDVVKLWKP